MNLDTFLLPYKVNCQCWSCTKQILRHHRRSNCHLNSVGIFITAFKRELKLSYVLHIIIWSETVIWPYLAWLLGKLLAWPWLYILFSRALSLSRCTSNLRPLLKCIAWPCHGPFSYNWWRQFYWLIAKSRRIVDRTSLICPPASMAVKREWFVVLTPMVLYIALKQDAVPLDNEHSLPEHKQRFYCAPVCERPNQCFVNHPRETCKHRSATCCQNIYGHTGTLIQMDEEHGANTMYCQPIIMSAFVAE